MEPPTICVFYFPPAVFKAAEAAAYLKVSRPKFEQLAKDNEDRLPRCNLSPGGDAIWLLTDLDKFLSWRRLVGYEARTS